MWQQGVRFTDLKLRTVASASEFSEARIELFVAPVFSCTGCHYAVAKSSLQSSTAACFGRGDTAGSLGIRRPVAATGLPLASVFLNHQKVLENEFQAPNVKEPETPQTEIGYTSERPLEAHTPSSDMLLFLP